MTHQGTDKLVPLISVTPQTPWTKEVARSNSSQICPHPQHNQVATLKESSSHMKLRWKKIFKWSVWERQRRRERESCKVTYVHKDMKSLQFWVQLCKSEIYSDFSGKKGTKFCNSHRKNIFSERQLFKWKLSDQEWWKPKPKRISVSNLLLVLRISSDT